MTDPLQVSVRRIAKTPYSRILLYPKSDEKEVLRRAKELERAGISTLQFSGSTIVDGIPVLGKGCVGIVTRATLDGCTVAVKIRRGDADRDTMLDEARKLRLANSVNVGPLLINATRNLLIMELFDGIPLYKWAEGLTDNDHSRIKQVLHQLLTDCFKLDAIGLDHGELSHAPKNVLVSREGHACIVDFESASTTRRVANVTSLMQYFLFGEISKRIQSITPFPRRREILTVLSRYKTEQTVESFQAILELLNLSL